MTCDEGEGRRRKGPSNFTLSVGGVIGIVGLLGSGIATYTAVQSDIANLKRGERYQERTNDQMRDEIKSVRSEQRETMREFNDKLDKIIDQGLRRR